MDLPINLILNIVEIGAIYALVVLSVFLSSKIISFDDLTVDGSFTAGGAVVVSLLLVGVNAVIATLAAVFVGGVAGLLTGILNTKLKLNNLISGIVITTGIFSINLKLAGANANLGVNKTIFDLLSFLQLGEASHLIVLVGICLGMIFTVKWLLQTEFGLVLKASGSNPQILTGLGKSINFYKISCLIISNSITGLAGALFVQHLGFFSITGCVGTLTVALAGLVIGSSISNNLVAKIVLGALAYQSIIALTLELQIEPVWNRLITAVLIIVLVGINNSKQG
ncbi:MAG: ABC transporter integral membrane protein [candidate division TM6 bacterium GW2011_GWF2_37_49]|nr:MAG: ABC transporter integral membrane protein [candidate division TM6 bacterium GW2011_GWF2_37_49]